MKKHLINLWFDLCDEINRRPVTLPAKEWEKKRIEHILFYRYGYDIALRYPFTVNP